MRISNCKAGAKAIGHDECAGGIVTNLCKLGLEIGDTHIAFPDHLLNSVTWVVGWKHEILFDEERRWQSQDEINEMKALGRLLARLEKLGGRQVIEYGEEE